MKKENGKQVTLNGTLFSEEDRIKLENDARDTFIDFLCGEEEFKVYIENGKYSGNNYLFSLSPSNFNQLYYG